MINKFLNINFVNKLPQYALELLNSQFKYYKGLVRARN
jgi:hypothetical protein